MPFQNNFFFLDSLTLEIKSQFPRWGGGGRAGRKEGNPPLRKPVDSTELINVTSFCLLKTDNTAELGNQFRDSLLFSFVHMPLIIKSICPNTLPEITECAYETTVIIH